MAPVDISRKGYERSKRAHRSGQTFSRNGTSRADLTVVRMLRHLDQMEERIELDSSRYEMAIRRSWRDVTMKIAERIVVIAADSHPLTIPGPQCVGVQRKVLKIGAGISNACILELAESNQIATCRIICRRLAARWR